MPCDDTPHLLLPEQRRVRDAYCEWFADPSDSKTTSELVLQAQEHLAACPMCRTQIFNLLKEKHPGRSDAAMLEMLEIDAAAGDEPEFKGTELPDAFRKTPLKRFSS